MELTIENKTVFIDPKVFFPQGKQFRTIECKITKRECWEVISHKPAGNGYVYLLWARDKHYKSFALHRLMYEYCYGEIPQDLCICHACDNPRCINPGHLWIGTHTDNRLDCVNKNRQARVATNVKLTAEQVQEIRADKISSQTALAGKYEVRCSTISNIKNFKSWAYLAQ